MTSTSDASNTPVTGGSTTDSQSPSQCRSSTTTTTSVARNTRGYVVEKRAAEIMKNLSFTPEIIHSSLPPTRYPLYEISIHTEIGSRKTQEDRCTFCPHLVQGRTDCSFFGVFDGTVGDFASDSVKRLVVPHLLGSSPWSRILEILTPSSLPEPSLVSSITDGEKRDARPPSSEMKTPPPSPEELPGLLCSALDWMYLNSDTELVSLCAETNSHYASSTSITVLIAGGYCCVGHLGDSRVALGHMRDDTMFGEFLTSDHKPNLPNEQERIVRNGGSVEYLHNHNNKPFIRGGDFTVRKARGEQPMQLQYSRAFGGKDLKMFGLSNEPDLCVFKLEPKHHVLILASDGLWDVLSAPKAIDLAIKAKLNGENSAMLIISYTLNEQRMKNQNADNITAIVIFLDYGKIESSTIASTATPTTTS